MAMAILSVSSRYSLTGCTWETMADMADSARLIKEFNAAAEEEGLDVRKLDIIVLKEAEAVGW